MMRCLDNYILYTYSSKRFANRQNNCVMLDYFKYMYTRVKKKKKERTFSYSWRIQKLLKQVSTTTNYVCNYVRCWTTTTILRAKGTKN